MDLSNQSWEALSSGGEDEDMDLGLAAQAPPLPPGRKGRSSPWAQLGKREVGVVGDPVQPEGPKHPRIQTPWPPQFSVLLCVIPRYTGLIVA